MLPMPVVRPQSLGYSETNNPNPESDDEFSTLCGCPLNSQNRPFPALNTFVLLPPQLHSDWSGSVGAHALALWDADKRQDR